MLVEDHERNNIVSCLLCKALIKVGNAPAAPHSSKPTPPPRK
jgi:hypothetical protein